MDEFGFTFIQKSNMSWREMKEKKTSKTLNEVTN